MAKHIIITRMFYDDFEMFETRAKLMKQTLIQTLKEQTNQKFIFAILGDNFIDKLKEIIDYDFIHFTSAEKCLEYCKQEKIQIQTRQDSDDYLAPNFCEFVQGMYDIHKGDSVLLNFNAEHIEAGTKKPLNIFTQYANNHTSMFLTLFDDNYELSVYAKPHNNMHKIVKSVITIEAGYVFYGIHENQIMKVPIEERKKLRQK